MPVKRIWQSRSMKLTSNFDYSGPMTETVLMGNIAIKSYMVEGVSKIKRVWLSSTKLHWKKKITLGWRQYEDHKFRGSKPVCWKNL